MKRQTVWVDVARCTGCGACVEVCPVGAIALVDGKAHVDEKTCAGCQACVNLCPEEAIQPVVQGELVVAPERPAPAVRQPGPLAETAGALARAVGRWLTQEPAPTGSPGGRTSPSVGGRGGGGHGRQGRRRQRGRRG